MSIAVRSLFPSTSGSALDGPPVLSVATRSAKAWEVTPAIRTNTGEKVLHFRPVEGAPVRDSRFYDASRPYKGVPAIADAVGVQIDQDGGWSFPQIDELNHRAEVQHWIMRFFSHEGEAPSYLLVEKLKDSEFVVSQAGQVAGHDMAHVLGLKLTPARFFEIWKRYGNFGEKILNDPKIRKILSSVRDPSLRLRMIEAICDAIYDDVERLTGLLAQYVYDHDFTQNLALRGMLGDDRSLVALAQRIDRKLTDTPLYSPDPPLPYDKAHALAWRIRALASEEPESPLDKVPDPEARQIVAEIQAQIGVKD